MLVSSEDCASLDGVRYVAQNACCPPCSNLYWTALADRRIYPRGSLTFFVTLTRARELFLNSQCRREAARPARAAWAVQRLLAARWRGAGGAVEAAAATLSGTGSASPRPDRTSWLRSLTSFVTHMRARELFLNSQCRREAARPARGAWAVQRLLAAATLSATGSASPRPDRTSWLRGRVNPFPHPLRARGR